MINGGVCQRRDDKNSLITQQVEKTQDALYNVLNYVGIWKGRVKKCLML